MRAWRQVSSPGFYGVALDRQGAPVASSILGGAYCNEIHRYTWHTGWFSVLCWQGRATGGGHGPFKR